MRLIAIKVAVYIQTLPPLDNRNLPFRIGTERRRERPYLSQTLVVAEGHQNLAEVLKMK